MVREKGRGNISERGKQGRPMGKNLIFKYPLFFNTEQLHYKYTDYFFTKQVIYRDKLFKPAEIIHCLYDNIVYQLIALFTTKINFNIEI